MPTKIIKLPEVIDLTSLSRSSIYQLISEGKFPKQIHLSERSVGWVLSEVQEFISNKIKESRNSEMK